MRQGIKHSQVGIGGLGQWISKGKDRRRKGNLKGRTPISEPSMEEVEEHRANGHANYRTWCSACVSGQGRQMGHKRVEDIDHRVPEVCSVLATMARSKKKQCAGEDKESEKENQDEREPEAP